MKTQFLMGIMVLLSGIGWAQEQIGPLSYTIPQGWSKSRTENGIVLQKPLQKGVVCKISISDVQKVAASTSAAYIQLRNALSYPGVSYFNSRGAISRYEANGLVAFFSRGRVTVGNSSAQNYFYSLSNGQVTVCYQLLTGNNECVESFNQFVQSITMEVAEGEGAVNAKRRKAAAGAPAAPAPMM